MNSILKLLTAIFSRLLFMYPGRFRNEFANEMNFVFKKTVTEAAQEGILSLLIVSIRELNGLMTGIMRELLSELDRNLQFGASLPSGSIRGWQLGALFLPFVLVLIVALKHWAYAAESRWLLTALSLMLLSLLVWVWMLGLIHSFPVWTLPAMGIILFLIVAFFHIATQILLYPVVDIFLEWVRGWPDHPDIARNLVSLLISQFTFLVIAVVLVVCLLRIVPGFHRQVRQEWTLLSFMLYGIAILPVVANDEYAGIGMYQTASLLVLIIGVIIYLMASKRWQRVLALVIAAVLSPMLISSGLYQTFPMQLWADPTNLSLRNWEALQPVLYLAPLPILLILAALAPQLPLGKDRELSPSS